MKNYMTGQRQIILSFFMENPTEAFSIDQIVKKLSGRSISRSAIYRNLDRMTEEGVLRKTVPQGSRKAFYQHAGCGGHCQRLHLQCEKCGRIFHLEDESDEMELRSVLEKNGFKLDGQAAVLPGVCKDCD